MLCRSCLRARTAAQQAGRPFAGHRTLIGATPLAAHCRRSMASAATAPSRATPPTFSRNSALPDYPFQRRLASQSAAAAAPAPSSDRPASSASSSTLEKPDFLDAAESEIWERLVKEFDPAELLVQDISGGCGSMYGIEISSDKFRGVNMLKQQRMVNAVLGDLMKQWHGVQLKTRTP